MFQEFVSVVLSILTRPNQARPTPTPSPSHRPFSSCAPPPARAGSGLAKVGKAWSRLANAIAPCGLLMDTCWCRAQILRNPIHKLCHPHQPAARTPANTTTPALPRDTMRRVFARNQRAAKLYRFSARTVHAVVQQSGCCICLSATRSQATYVPTPTNHNTAASPPSILIRLPRCLRA